MKNICFLALLIVLTGCSGIRTQPQSAGIFPHVANNQLTQLQELVDQKIDIDAVDEFGRTRLHYAMNHKNSAAKILLTGGANPNIQDTWGFSPLHAAVYYRNSAMIIPLLMAGADIEALTFNKYKCSRYRKRKAEGGRGITAIELASRCNDYSGRAVFKRYQDDTSAWQLAQHDNSIASYEAYLAQVKDPLFASQAQEKIDEAAEKRRLTLQQNEVCQLNQEGWYLTEGQCKNDLASGEGKAVTLKNKQFIGTFSAGKMVFGQLLVDDKMLWKGTIVDGKPDGEGICVFNGAAEECKCYLGDRIDSLHKQREMMVVHMSNLERKITDLQHSINRQRRAIEQGSNSASSDLPFGYLADLNSKDDYKRTSAQIRGAIDLFKVLSD